MQYLISFHNSPTVLWAQRVYSEVCTYSFYMVYHFKGGSYNPIQYKVDSEGNSHEGLQSRAHSH